MPFLVTVLLVIAVHLVTNLAAWQRVGLLADDRFAVGLSALMQLQGKTLLEQLEVLFAPQLLPDQPNALYRPFLQLLYLFEYPCFGTSAKGYHVTNSVLHCATAMLWWVLVRRLSGSATAATATAVAFVGWPGHGEATHWIASRVNLLSAFWMSVALVCWTPASGPRGWLRIAGTVVCSVLALGSKESAVLIVPLLLLVDALRPGSAMAGGGTLRRRVVRLVLPSLPVWIALFAWLSLRASMLHTWGTGRSPAWQLDVWSPLAWLTAIWEWLRVLVAPVHEHFAAWAVTPLTTLHVALLWSAFRRGRPEWGRTLWFGAGTFTCCLLAIAGLKHSVATLEGMRHSYEAALGLATLLGLGIAGLPERWQRPALLLLILVHALVLDANRECWLRAGALRSRAEAEAFTAAVRSADPVRVLDVPSIWHGAFVQLIEDPTVFAVPFAPATAAGRGHASPVSSWPVVLHELAGRAAKREPLLGAYTVGWADGHLQRLLWDDRWPLEVLPGVTIEFARLGRARPLLGTTMPVQVLVRASTTAVFTVIASIPASTFEQVSREVGPRPESQPVALDLWLPPELAPDAPVEISVRVNAGGHEREIPLGSVVPAAWSLRPW